MSKAYVIIGIVLITLSLTAAGIIFGRLYVARAAYEAKKNPVVRAFQRVASPLHRDSQDSEKNLQPVSKEFGIVIPKIDVNAPIIQDVSGINANEYLKQLKKGVGHLKNSALPDNNGNVVIFGHSSSVPGIAETKYTQVFLLLDKLEKGDEIMVFYNDQQYVYRVQTVEEVGESATEILEDTSMPTLTLITCWPPGTEARRIVVRATKKE